ncbi:MAG: alpha/beta fold hydrolase [Deferrisomatales bacterium]
MTLTEVDFRINPTVYEWTGRTISLLRKVLKINVKLHHARGQLEAGEIFLFNHFARFETFIPQYLIYRETGALSRSVGSAELFQGNETFTRFLLSLGGVPNDYPSLLPFLAAEVLRGRKVILFPEGGMVKDRRVLDRRGRYSIYSRSAQERRKHHTGAAVVAQAVEAFRRAVRRAAEAGHEDQVAHWAEGLGLDGPDALLEAARRPTVIVPANITFYPIRIEASWLQRGAELFSRGLEPRFAEELLIEGNLLLRHTDMDIRLGEPVSPADFWGRGERWLVQRVADKVGTLEGFLSSRTETSRWEERLWNHRARRRALRVRDAYMEEMYRGLTVNLSHLASHLLFAQVERGVLAVGATELRRTLYLAVKRVQQETGVHLHRSLRNPQAYAGLLRGECPGLDQLLATAEGLGLVTRVDDWYRLAPQLREEHDFDHVRLGNPLAVYANELAPLAGAVRGVNRALEEAPGLSERALALLRFDDEVRSYRWDRRAFRKPRHEAINREETATRSGEPFLFLPKRPHRLGVLLVHGFTASPAEVLPLGERLRDHRFPTLGVRLQGHGTSPWDLLERSWEDWLASVRRGYEILSAFSERVCLVGFSAGGALALRLAAESPPGLAGVAAVAPPLKVRDKAMMLVPWVHGANRLAKSTSLVRGVMLFSKGHPEHPEVNYQHMPIRALYELSLLMADVEEHLGRVRCPVLLVQGTGDPTVDPKSAEIILDGLGSVRKELVEVPSNRHGLLYEDVGGTQGRVLEFVAGLEPGSCEPDSP